MANNTPITARISKGLFGKSSSKVTEPLLNVGPAGVSGNNQTKDVPSPSKMKSAFKMMTSPFKQAATEVEKPKKEKSPSQKVYTYVEGIKGTEDQVVKGSGAIITENYDKLTKGAKNLGPGYKPSAAETARANKDVADARAKDKAATDAGGTETIIPGKKGTPGALENTELYTREKGDAQTALDSRNVIRMGLQANRKLKRATIKNAADKFGRGSEEFKKAKGGAKETQSESNKAIAAASVAATLRQAEQGVKGGSTKDVLGEEKILTAANASIPDQERRIKEESSARAAANAGGTTAGKFESTFKGGVDKVSSKFSTPEGKKETVSTENKADEAPLGTYKKDNGFFAKKSPMKLKYFK